MADYTLTNIKTIDVDNTLKQITNIKDIFNIEFLENEDNISLLNNKCFLLYNKILELESRIKSLEKR
jgi:hypothetical protein